MQQSDSMPGHFSSTSDAAVSGLFGGLLAGVIMAVSLAAAGMLDGQGPMAYLAAFAVSGGNAPFLGLLSHLAVSAVYGLLYGAVYHWARLGRLHFFPRWLAGLLYGILLWLAAVLLIVPGAATALGAIPAGHFLAAHLLYGLVLGWKQKP